METPVRYQKTFQPYHLDEHILDKIVGGNAAELLDIRPPAGLERVASPSDQEMAELVAEALS